MTGLQGARWVIGAAALAATCDVVYTDEKFHRIPNRRLLVYLAAGLAGYAALLAAATAAHFESLAMSFPYPAWGFFPAAAVQTGLSAAAAILLWRLGRWPAGDAKLFAVVSLWLSVADPGSPLLPWRLPLIFLMNVFIPAALFILARMTVWVWRYKLQHSVGFWRQLGLRRVPGYLRDSHEGLKTYLKGFLERWRLQAQKDPSSALRRAADLLAMAAAGACVTIWLGPRLAPGLPAPLLGISACLAWDTVRRLAGSQASWLIFAAGLAAAGWALPEHSWLEFAAGWSQWILFMLLWEVGTLAVQIFLGAGERVLVLLWLAALALGLAGGPWVLLRFFGFAKSGLLSWGGVFLGMGALYMLVSAFFEEDLDRLPPEKFHAWLVPADSTLELLRSEPAYFAEHFSRLYPDGLTPAQVDALADFCRRRAIPEVIFRRTIPFAKWIILGAVLTNLLRRDLLGAFVAGRAGG